MRGFRVGGPHDLAAGEWTDDTSMALALPDSLYEADWDLDDQAERYLAWWTRGDCSVNGRVFDIGMTTVRARRSTSSTGSRPWCRGPGPTSVASTGFAAWLCSVRRCARSTFRPTLAASGEVGTPVRS